MTDPDHMTTEFTGIFASVVTGGYKATSEHTVNKQVNMAWRAERGTACKVYWTARVRIPVACCIFFPENFRRIELCRLEYLRVVFWASLIVVYNFERRVIDCVPTKATIINYIEFFLF